ncbi:MAG: ABC transporter permease [Clostridiales Family XIII bacterium]|jgi:ABC-2 type transport system permease protein|nr:ABC transporter permease [Clostridiales Family XIII bacterium]
MKRTGIIIKFEYLGYVKAKSFVITTLIFAILLLLATSIPSFAGLLSGTAEKVTGGESKAVVLLGPNVFDKSSGQGLEAEYLGALTKGTKWTDGNAKKIKQEDLKGLVEENDYDFAFYYDGGTDYDYYARGDNLGAYDQVAVLDALVTEAAKEEALLGVPEDVRNDVEEISGITASCNLISIGGEAGDNFWICYVFAMFLYFVLMMYGNFVTSSVVTEKTSKTMELLITAAKPIELMMGKVFGVGLAALTQVGFIILSVGTGLALNLDKWKEFQPGIWSLLTESKLSISLVVFAVVLFLLGYFFYAFIYAALGSTVSKPEEAATVTVLPIMLLIAAFLLSFLSFGLNKAIVAVLSYIPPFTPFIMMNRYVRGDAGLTSMLIGIAVLFAGVMLVAWVAAKIYRVGVMMYGKPMGLVSLIKTMRQ